MDKSRVVVTGLGIISPVGNTVEDAWANIKAGRSGIDDIRSFDPATVGVRAVGEVKNFDPVAVFGAREARRLDRVIQFSLVAAQQALADSGLQITDENAEHIGCLVGSGMGGIESAYEAQREFDEKGHKSVSPFAITRLLPDSSAGRVSIEFGLRGPNFCISSACATGNNSIGEAADQIRLGRARVMLAGASDACLVGPIISSFNNMKALSRFDGDPALASRPFDLNRDGFVQAEGAAVIILEDREHAVARGAHIYAEITGYGHTSDAYHITATKEDGAEAARAMRLALHNAGLNAEDIDYINAHGTSTPLNDKSETTAIKRALGEQAYSIPISSTKSMTGHMLGAGGAAEAVFSILALRDQFVPPTINLETPDPECDLDYVPNSGRAHPIRHVMSNSFGFGGHNAVLIFSRCDERLPA